MNQPGQPFVDIGSGIGAQLTGKKSLTEVTSHDLRQAVARLEEHLGSVQKLKVLAAYWQNNSLIGINPGQIAAYRQKLHSLTQEIPSSGGVCQVCGRQGVFADANRSWFPLAAGADGDPVTLPNLRGKFICADCFRAVVLLPMGCKLCKSGIYAFHLLDPQLQVEAVAPGVKAVRDAILSNVSGNAALKTKTRLSGRLELLEIATQSRLWGADNDGMLSRRASNGATILAFSNSGTSAAFHQLNLPATALDFFGELYRNSEQKDIFLNWAEKSKNTFYDRICDDIEMRQSIAPILAAMVRARKEPRLTGEEKNVLKLYEDVALKKSKRFDALALIAERVKDMPLRYRASFIKQLGNTRSKESFMLLLTDLSKNRDKTNFRLTKEECQIINDSPAGEVISLLYLLCVADE